MIEPRIYRAAFIPALLAVVLAMFSLESRPRPLAQGLAADVVFGGASAVTTTRSLVEQAPDRRAGKPGDRRAARVVKDALRQSGFTVEVDRFERDDKDLVNVIGRRAGSSRRQVVVVAARDAAGVPDAAGSASDTAALIELARVFEGRPSGKTLVLASVDGSALGEAGAGRLARRLDDDDLVDGVIVVSGLGRRTRDPPELVAWSSDTTRAGIGLQRTVAESLRQEVGRVAEGPGAAGQLARLAFPLGIGSQGVLLEEGFDAVRIAGAGELGDGGESVSADIDPDRLGSLGRAALRALGALDAGPRPKRGPREHLTVGSQVMPGWVFYVLALTLVLPAVVASVDALARARRRREPVAPWLRWIGAGAGGLVAGLLLAHALSLAGAMPESSGAPVPPEHFPLDVPALACLLAVTLVTVAGWLALRRLALRGEGGPSNPATAPGAGVAVAVVLSFGVLALWTVNPFAALVMVPALHAALLVSITDPPPPRRVRAAFVVVGLLPPLLLAVYQLAILSIDPLTGAWYLTLLVTGGHVGLLGAILSCVLLATLACVLVLASRQDPVEEPTAAPSVRGPATYAGPGSLGGTESALGGR